MSRNRPSAARLTENMTRSARPEECFFERHESPRRNRLGKTSEFDRVLSRLSPFTKEMPLRARCTPALLSPRVPSAMFRIEWLIARPGSVFGLKRSFSRRLPGRRPPARLEQAAGGKLLAGPCRSNTSSEGAGRALCRPAAPLRLQHPVDNLHPVTRQADHPLDEIRSLGRDGGKTTTSPARASEPKMRPLEGAHREGAGVARIAVGPSCSRRGNRRSAACPSSTRNWNPEGLEEERAEHARRISSGRPVFTVFPDARRLGCAAMIRLTLFAIMRGGRLGSAPRSVKKPAAQFARRGAAL